MNPFEWIMKGRFGAAFRAGAGFVTVSIIGAIGLVVLAIVLWAASLTPFGLWAGLPVIAAGGIVAAVLWRQGRVAPDVSMQGSEASASLPPLSWLPGSARPAGPRSLTGPAGEVTRPPLIKLTGVSASMPPRVPRLKAKDPGPPQPEDLKRTFDQAFAAGRFDEADGVLTELGKMPGQAEWTQRKRRLVRQQRART